MAAFPHPCSALVCPYPEGSDQLSSQIRAIFKLVDDDRMGLVQAADSLETLFSSAGLVYFMHIPSRQVSEQACSKNREERFGGHNRPGTVPHRTTAENYGRLEFR